MTDQTTTATAGQPASKGAVDNGQTAAQEVAVLVIEHRHGVDVDVYTSEASARDAVRSYVEDWWAREIGEPTPEPVTDADIETYFDAVDEEFYTITRCEVRP